MGDVGRWDSVCQAVNVLGAPSQIGAPVLTSEAVGQVSAENGTLVVSTDYAFAIWGPIFLLCLAYAAYKALLTNRESPLLRCVGWFSSGTFLFSGLSEILFPARQFLLAQAVIVTIFVCAAVAYLRIARLERGVLSAGEGWLVALPLGLLFGWITGATLVSFATTFVALGLLEGGTGEAIIGVALLLTSGLVAPAVVLAGETAPTQVYLAYTASVLWALAAVVVNQYDASVLTTVAALVAAVPVALAVIDKLLGRPGRRTKRTPSPTPQLEFTSQGSR